MADSSDVVPAWGCNICFEEASDPVSTTCGHLFCWPCLYPWVHDMAKPCPVCRFPLIVVAHIFPVYGTARAESSQAAAASIPPRPLPARQSAPATPTNAVPEQASSSARFNRETLRRMQQEQTLERSQLAIRAASTAQFRNVLDEDARSLSRMSRELLHLRRSETGSATGGDGQIAGHRRMDLEFPLDREIITLVLDAILGRRRGTRLS